MPSPVLKALERKWSEDLRKQVAGTVVALDGKALRHASMDGVHIPYVVSAWSCECGFVMGEEKTDEESNEITALPGVSHLKSNDTLSAPIGATRLLKRFLS